VAPVTNIGFVKAKAAPFQGGFRQYSLSNVSKSTGWPLSNYYPEPKRNSIPLHPNPPQEKGVKGRNCFPALVSNCKPKTRNQEPKTENCF
jgi:hypothetical protein